MKKIGFIDYYLDEFHANKYPEWISEASGGKMKVVYAYGMVDKENGVSNQEWCNQRGIQLLSSIDEVVRLSDYLIVLSPDNPEFHEELSNLPLQSGKPTYIDKTFAPDRAAAIRLFELANQHETPLFSTSALRYADEYVKAVKEGIETISSWGPGRFENYSIHQIEPIVSLMGSHPQRVMSIGSAASSALLIDFGAGKQATINHFGDGCPFMMAVNDNTNQCQIIKPESDFFALFIRHLVSFFESGKPAVPAEETIAVITIIEYGLQAAETPAKWLNLPNVG